MMKGLINTFESLEAKPEVKVVVLTHTGKVRGASSNQCSHGFFWHQLK
jgi:hypothetical protein